MSIQIEPSFIETIANMLLMIVGVFVAMSASYFVGRFEENKRIFVQRVQEERRIRLIKLLDRIGIEDLERYS